MDHMTDEEKVRYIRRLLFGPEGRDPDVEWSCDVIELIAEVVGLEPEEGTP